MEVISKAYKGNSRRYDDAIRTIKKEWDVENQRKTNGLK
jgi:hypothetical protein